MDKKFWFWWIIWSCIFSGVVGLITGLGNLILWLFGIIPVNWLIVLSLVIYIGLGYLITKLTERNWRGIGEELDD